MPRTLDSEIMDDDEDPDAPAPGNAEQAPKVNSPSPTDSVSPETPTQPSS